MSELQNVVYVTPYLEHPSAGGPQLRVETSIKALSSVAHLHVVHICPVEPKDIRQVHDFFKSIAASVASFYTYPKNRFVRKLLKILQYIFHREAKNNIHELVDVIKKENAQIVWFGFGNISFDLIKQVKEMLPDIKIVCDTDSVWSRFILRELPFASGERYEQILKAGREKELEEQNWVNLCDVTTAVSSIDAEYYKSLAQNTDRVKIFSNVIDLDDYDNYYKEPKNFGNKAIILSGSFGPNSAMSLAGRWMIDKILPEVLRRHPDVTLYIVGRNSDGEFKGHSSKNVVVTGQVDSVLPYLQNAIISVVPLMFESGTRFKILEAGACGTAIVSTTLGAEGLPIINNKHALIADDVETFSSAIINLLDDKDLRINLERECRKLVRGKYGLNNLASEANDILEFINGG